MGVTKILHAENFTCFEMPSFSANKSMLSHLEILFAYLIHFSIKKGDITHLWSTGNLRPGIKQIF